MSANSYPSPISSASSPQLNGSPSSRGIPTRDRRGRQHTQRSLQSAAADLEAAFSRLEQVRTSLMQISSRFPDSRTQAANREQLGPGHDAIVLAGEPGGGEPLSRADGNQNAEDPESLLQVENYRRLLRLQAHAQFAMEQASLNQQANAPSLSPVPDPPVARFQHQPLPPVSQASTSLESSFSSRDDGFTALGRHVNAREAAAQRRPDSTPNEDRSYQPTASMRSERQGRLHPLVEEALVHAGSQSDPSELRRLSQIQSQLSSAATPPPAPWRPEPRRRRPLRTDTRPPSTRTSTSGGTGSDHLSRLSMLSSLSLQNFSAPASAAPSSGRPLLFEEPESYTDGPPPQPLELDTIVDDIPFGRNYIIRRHMNPEGTERVQNINLSLDFYDSSGFGWVPPRSEGSDPNAADATARRRTTLTHRPTYITTPSDHSAPMPSRRRGWARLDPDGNEIPSDEEEELERYRTEYRVRATTNRSHGPGFAVSPYGPPSAADLTRGPIYDHGSVMDSVTSVRDPYLRHGSSSRRQHHQSSVMVTMRTKEPTLDHLCNPLPTPLKDMMGPDVRSRRGESVPVLSVSPMASFAGR